MFKQSASEGITITQNDFVKRLQASTGNPGIESTATHFMRRKAYPVNDRETFLHYFIENCKYGIPDDDDLRYCYRGIENDIEALIDQGWIRVIKTQDSNKKKDCEENKKRFLFPCNKNEKDIEVDFPKNCQSYMADLWENKVGENSKIKWEDMLQSEPNLLSEKEREILVTRQTKSICRLEDEASM